MRTKRFLEAIDEAPVIEAIREAERCTRGEIVVYVSRRSPADPVARATKRFHKLGLDQTRERNAVMLYFAPRVQKFAVIGDTAIHAVCGQAFWDDLAATMGTALREQQFQAAIIVAVKRVGELLAAHFPATGENPDELPNRVLGD